MSSSRLHYYDNLKFLLVTLVVVGHAVDISVVHSHEMAKALFVFIYSFHMPLFIFISGLFTNRDKLSQTNTFRRFLYFTVLGFALKVLLIIVPAAFGKQVTFYFLGDSSLPWYMFAMAAFFALAYYLREVDRASVLLFSVLLGLMVGYDDSVGDYLYLSRIVVFFPFFWMGHMMSPSAVELAFRRGLLRAAGGAAVIVFAAFCVLHTKDIYCFRGLFTGRNSYSSVAIEDCSFVDRATAYLISLCVCVGILSVVPHVRLPFISDGGARTLQVFFFHYPLVQLLYYSGILGSIEGSFPHGWLLIIPIGVLISFVLAIPIFEPPFTYLYFRIRKSPSAG